MLSPLICTPNTLSCSVAAMEPTSAVPPEEDGQAEKNKRGHGGEQ